MTTYTAIFLAGLLCACGAQELAERQEVVERHDEGVEKPSPTESATMARLEALEQEVASQREVVNAARRLVELLTVDSDGDVVLSGANFKINKGPGTDKPNGKGNVLIGYHFPVTPTPLRRSGSHNLIVGEWHEYTGTGAIVSGTDNRSLADNASVIGGYQNTNASEDSTILSGSHNSLSGGGRICLVGGIKLSVDADRLDVRAILGGYTPLPIGKGHADLVTLERWTQKMDRFRRDPELDP
jgi:hypothetical protein